MKDKSAAAGNWPGKLEWLFVTLLSAGYLCDIKMQLSVRSCIPQFSTEKKDIVYFSEASCDNLENAYFNKTCHGFRIYLHVDTH